jgi:hypothetical protein
MTRNSLFKKERIRLLQIAIHTRDTVRAVESGEATIGVAVVDRAWVIELVVRLLGGAWHLAKVRTQSLHGVRGHLTRSSAGEG